jgi:hypothetical protein
MPSLLHDDLFIYSMSIESSSICGPQGVICSITLDASSFAKARNSLAKFVMSQWLLGIPTVLSGFGQGFQVECVLWITRTAAKVELEQPNKAPVWVFGVCIVFHNLWLYFLLLQASRVIF